MEISGASYIAGQWQIAENAQAFFGFSPKHNQPLTTPIYEATSQMLQEAIDASAKAFVSYRQTSFAQRATFLFAIADEIEALGEALIHVTHEETNLPIARLQGERGRTLNQLRAFAQALEQSRNGVLDLAQEDLADPSRSPLPKPYTQLNYLPVGVVAVFGASNFPYAFSTLGGDTASALAAGCPVIMKSHTAHPATSELMTKAIDRAISKTNMPAGVFSMIQAKSYDIAHQLVAAPSVKAVGFTGSFNVAQKLMDTIAKRAERIPFYGELGSINPQLIFDERLVQQSEPLAQQLCQSLLMGNGQFCTSPGLWVVPTGSETFIETVKQQLNGSQSDTLLSPNIVNSYKQSIERLKATSGVSLLAQGHLLESFHANAHLFATDADTYLANSELHEEVFGPCAMLVTYENETQLSELVDNLQGQLTASIHGTEGDFTNHHQVIESLQYKVGRLIENQMPTGVEVCPSMNHGGPFPSSTDVRSTSVGLNAMQRFLRPLCRQRAN
ncbi:MULTISPECIES: aldehyde dehydrogenase (NADP(+)) [Pseudoalteromonas]|uniref:Aldehyde dehydrogenase n=1 Tax=Pseudoalteromonas amylolytica TaxID=1859457 RepID=A0A1S1MX10_9GAMM|nr:MULTISPECIES: aldehyde dehydrogenase (NADP(+)) [Pseudoalteromonas]OHU87989.1 aldehyde dehydrogenase [Pseudoalteromonas sp. JW3]OHU91429.1 aldehyde dehydrogenase [Pseudoalteromonas amylolytica]